MARMTVQDLLDALEGVDPDTEVVMAIQPNWPMQVDLVQVHTPDQIAGNIELEGREDVDFAVYLVAGGDTSLLPYVLDVEFGWK